MNTSIAQNWFLSTILYQMEPDFSGEMADSRADTGKVQDELGTSFYARK